MFIILSYFSKEWKGHGYESFRIEYDIGYIILQNKVDSDSVNSWHEQEIKRKVEAMNIHAILCIIIKNIPGKEIVWGRKSHGEIIGVKCQNVI